MATYTATFTDVVNAVSEKLRLDLADDTTKTGVWVNRAIAKIAIQTGYFKGQVNGTPLVAGDSSQALPPTLVRLDYVTTFYQGQTYPQLNEMTTLDPILAYRSQGASTGPPRIYYLWQGSVEFWPSAAGGEVLSYYGSILPDTISGTTPIPVPEPFSKLVEYMACFEAAQYKKDPLIEEFRDLAREEMIAFRAYLNQRRGRKGLQFDVKVMEETYPPHDPSTDLLSWP